MRTSREKMSAIKREAHRNRKMTCLRGNEVSNFDVHRVFSHLASSRVVAKEGLQHMAETMWAPAELVRDDRRVAIKLHAAVDWITILNQQGNFSRKMVAFRKWLSRAPSAISAFANKFIALEGDNDPGRQPSHNCRLHKRVHSQGAHEHGQWPSAKYSRQQLERANISAKNEHIML